ncbi:DNA repair protein RecO [Cylindrospermopsis raciborskii S07]|uniref:DNA repair protein RecO n=3 Tax=Cylindrospermopsis raciborskii TaxID=77022 RepID=A0A853MDV0_9CYAN|nr:DNA repair protein RecO [Cylindrospermopsis raciborskii]EFA70426.1 Recombination protein O, RecO [Cylindrospermopsis raciborskii CS-505]MBA4444210.1 DNA repair protein RecO [Cylindrospermopsis raciborskii CS-506_C]MBA4448430.1 DNA repair protein RecO [Cylindrospermopsis raciborskii CS-506_D]MBA4455058.1 DNA repair protein RecO [Cylindrospermopsis raciborskii CS-506_B]MBA4464394.1 DNA repair protein RecO [Cylindrospermopsis raciborskii CS-506_A]
MNGSYHVRGINLKSQFLGESDKILTVLTRELGLIKAIAPGSRKYQSSLNGRSGIFTVNELLISLGKSNPTQTSNLYKINQAQTLKTYPGLTKSLGKLAASQYLAEIALHQALEEHTQVELYDLLNQHLDTLDSLPPIPQIAIVAHLAKGVFDMLKLAGISPQIQVCCLTQKPLIPDLSNPKWQAGFSTTAGGTICLQTWENIKKQEKFHEPKIPENDFERVLHHQELPKISRRLGAKELMMLQYLSQPGIIQIDSAYDDSWLSVEQILRHYTQYHLGFPIRSATLIDSYFAPNHDAIV